MILPSSLETQQRLNIKISEYVFFPLFIKLQNGAFGMFLRFFTQKVTRHHKHTIKLLYHFVVLLLSHVAGGLP